MNVTSTGKQRAQSTERRNAGSGFKRHAISQSTFQNRCNEEKAIYQTNTSVLMRLTTEEKRAFTHPCQIIIHSTADN